MLAAFTAACVYALLLFGAEVRGTGAALVFPDWPLFNGQLVPSLSADPTIAQMQVLQFLHRLVALVAGLVVLWTAWVTWRRYDRHAWGPAAARPTLLLLVGSSAALFLIQSIVGAAQIFTDLAAWAEALHVGLGAAIWGLLVAATVYAWCEARRPAGAPADGTPRGVPGDRREDAGQPVAQPGGLALAVEDDPHPSRRQVVRAYIALTKPRIIELLLVTTVPAMILAAHGMPPLTLIVATLVGGSLAAGSANAINQYLDRDIDALMTRTRRRPLPAHAVTPENALVFGFALGVIAFAELTLLVNLLAAFLALLAIGFYVVVYTMLLKRTTPQNIVIGGAAGALPPVIGVAAVTGDITLPALVLFAIVFYWTPPHFWALALRLSKDYRARRRADAAGGARRAGDDPPDPALHAGAGGPHPGLLRGRPHGRHLPRVGARPGRRLHLAGDPPATPGPLPGGVTGPGHPPVPLLDRLPQPALHRRRRRHARGHPDPDRLTGPTAARWRSSCSS